MGLIESIKAAAIRATDCANKLNDPFLPFDRPAFTKEQKKLSDLEVEFYQDLVNHFWGCDGQVLLHRIPLPPGSPLDTGDQAIWHGVLTAALALRYHLSTDSEQKDTYGHLVDASKGLRLHQTAHGEAKPRLIRGISDDLKTWQDDASNDSATGHLLGIYFGWRFGPETMRPVFAQLAGGLGAELLNHGHALVRADGTPTTYGALEQGWKTDPLRISLALAVYATAASLTGVPEFAKAYSDLFARYGKLACYPKVKLWWIDNQNDTHRAAIHLAILADLTIGEPCALYCRGLRRIREMTAKEGNVWVNALCGWGTQSGYPDDRDLALKVLSEFTLKDKQFNDGKENYPIPEQFTNAGIRAVKWGDTYRASQPLPRWSVRAQDFFWQRNLRSLDVGSKGAEPDSRLNGGDFLAAYWLSRLTNILNAND
jgi:hypothetical protein